LVKKLLVDLKDEMERVSEECSKRKLNCSTAMRRLADLSELYNRLNQSILHFQINRNFGAGEGEVQPTPEEVAAMPAAMRASAPTPNQNANRQGQRPAQINNRPIPGQKG